MRAGKRSDADVDAALAARGLSLPRSDGLVPREGQARLETLVALEHAERVAVLLTELNLPTKKDTESDVECEQRLADHHKIIPMKRWADGSPISGKSFWLETMGFAMSHYSFQYSVECEQ